MQIAGGGLRLCVGHRRLLSRIHPIFVQIGYRKAEAVVVPNQIAVLDSKIGELYGIEVDTNQRILTATQERLEIEDSLGTVAKLHSQRKIGNALGGCDVDDCASRQRQTILCLIFVTWMGL